MGETIAIQFDLAAETVQFSKEEFEGVVISADKDYSFLKNQSGVSNILYQGDLNKILTATFIEDKATTRAKIDKLIDEEDEMTIYYEYRYDPTVTMEVILFSKGNVKRSEFYYYGEKAAKVKHVLSFLQSS